MSLPPGYAGRPAGAGDIDGVLAILHARDVREVGRPDSSAAFVLETWRSPRVNVQTDTLVVEDRHATVVAYAEVTQVDDPAYVNAWGQIHPAHLGRGLGAALLKWAELRAAATTAAALHQHLDGGDAGGRSLFEAHGYRRVRTSLHMILDLGTAPMTAPPEGITIRPMRRGDERAIHDVLQEAFADHFALTVEPFDVWWEEWRDDPLFDRELFWVAEDAAAGVVGVACDFQDEGVGWIGDLGVRRAWRGRGIGRALLSASFAAFSGRGLGVARLNVDAENETGAPALYRAMGMREHRRFLVMEKRLRPEG